MTEKRFEATYDDGYCVCDNETDLLYHMDNDMITNEMTKLLNALNDENEQLKRQIGNLEHTKDFCADVCADCERLEKENEQLKQEIKDIEKVKDAFYDKVFSLINQFIEYNQLKVGNHDDVVDNLRELRKELKGDVE